MKYTPKGSREESEMCFYIPSTVQNNPPQPIERKLSILDRDLGTIFVR